MPSIREVAKKAGVSIATVSRVINGAESVAPNLRTKVMSAVESCEYRPATGRRAMDSIALIYAGPFCVGSPYDSACTEGMVECMRESIYDLTIVDIHRDKAANESLRQFFARKGIRGAIVRSTSAERKLLREWAAEDLPLVVLGDHFDCPKLSFVYAESKTASLEAMEHFVSIGHERIAFAACDRDDGDHLDRLLAYLEVMETHGLTDDSLVCRMPANRMDGVQLLRNLLGMPNRPTALFIADPLIATGAINEAHRLGMKIPDDLSIIGFDDTDTRSSVYPRMSAICQDAKQLGQTAFNCLLDRIEASSGSVPASSPHQAWLEISNTTGPPPAAPERILPTGARLPG